MNTLVTISYYLLKVMEWFGKLEGESKKKALELLQTGCRELLKITLGEDKVIQVKQMKESGSDVNTISNKIDEWIKGLNENSHLRKIIEEYRPICRQLFGIEKEKKTEEEKPVGRKRRSSWKSIYGKKHRNLRNSDEDEEEVEVDTEEYTNPRVSNIEETDDQTEKRSGFTIITF